MSDNLQVVLLIAIVHYFHMVCMHVFFITFSLQFTIIVYTWFIGLICLVSSPKVAGLSLAVVCHVPDQDTLSSLSWSNQLQWVTATAMDHLPLIHRNLIQAPTLLAWRVHVYFTLCLFVGVHAVCDGCGRPLAGRARTNVLLY